MQIGKEYMNGAKKWPVRVATHAIATGHLDVWNIDRDSRRLCFDESN
jgi:hypothetical protein